MEPFRRGRPTRQSPTAPNWLHQLPPTRPSRQTAYLLPPPPPRAADTRPPLQAQSRQPLPWRNSPPPSNHRHPPIAISIRPPRNHRHPPNSSRLNHRHPPSSRVTEFRKMFLEQDLRRILRGRHLACPTKPQAFHQVGILLLPLGAQPSPLHLLAIPIESVRELQRQLAELTPAWACHRVTVTPRT